MHNIQRSKITSAMATRDYLPQYIAITNLLPQFTGNYTGLQTTITQILSIISLQDIEKKGITASKKTLRENLCMLTADCSRKLVTYALYNNNEVLTKEIHVVLSKLKQMSDISLRTKAQVIYERAQLHIASLAIYGITPASQAALLNAITSFTAYIPKPKLGIHERKQATQQLAALMKQMNMYLKNLDHAVEIVRLTQVNFYNGYTATRKLVMTGTGSLAVNGVVINADSGDYIKGAKITFTRIEPGVMSRSEMNMQEGVVKKTAAKGGFKVKSLPSGMYLLTVSMVGFPDHVSEIAVSPDEKNSLKIKLRKGKSN